MKVGQDSIINNMAREGFEMRLEEVGVFVE